MITKSEPSKWYWFKYKCKRVLYKMGMKTPDQKQAIQRYKKLSDEFNRSHDITLVVRKDGKETFHDGSFIKYLFGN